MSFFDFMLWCDRVAEEQPDLDLPDEEEFYEYEDQPDFDPLYDTHIEYYL